MELTDLDYQILEFISEFETVKKDLILKHFSSNIGAIEYRLDLLSKFSYREAFNFNTGRTFPGSPIKNSNYIIRVHETLQNKDQNFTETFKYTITEKGKKALSDYKYQKSIDSKHQRKENRKYWAPIVISAIALLKSFDREIISVWQWLMLILR